jgi:hypothetical protein
MDVFGVLPNFAYQWSKLRRLFPKAFVSCREQGVETVSSLVEPNI